jgi:hypothetical protein
MIRILIFISLALTFSLTHAADKRKKKPVIEFEALTVIGTPDTVKKAPTPKDPFKPIMEFAEKSVKFDGLFPIYQDTASGKLYIEISEDKLGKEFIYFSQGWNGVLEAGNIRGSYRDYKIFKIERYFDRIDIEIQNTNFYFDPANALSKAADANINRPIAVAEKIVASSVDSAGVRSYLIDADPLFIKESITQVKSSPRPGERPEQFKLGNLNDKKSKYTGVFNYPQNTDVRAAYVYETPYPMGRGGNEVTDPRFVTVEVHHSLIAIPENDYRPRRDDPRVGYFMRQITNMTSTKVTPYEDVIHRWHLQKKDPEAALSEPVEPIVWWIENTTPHEFRPIIKDAALQWNRAFESAGFINALQIYEQPDTATWDAGDIRYNVLRWTSSPQPPFGGYGPSFVNPRTGQILGADIMLEWVYMSNRVMQESIYDQAGMPNMEEMDEHGCHAGLYTQLGRQFGSTVLQAMGFEGIEDRELLRQALYHLVLHELGHTLGLNHNFAGSLLNTPEQLQDVERGSTYGLNASVMDYPPVSLSRDRTRQGLYYDVIPGPYDHWAIEFGYKEFADETVEADSLAAILARSTEPANLFFNDADDMRSTGRGINPKAMLFDMSADPITDAINKMEIVREARSKIMEKFAKDGHTYHELRNAYLVLSGNYASALNVISKYIGGVYVDRSVVGQNPGSKPFTPVPAAEQKRAMQTLAKYAFSKDAFNDGGLLAYLQMQRRGFNFGGTTEDPKELDRVIGAQRNLLDQLLHPEVMKRIITTQLYGNQYPLTAMLADLTNAVFKEDISGSVIPYRQNLQVEYLERLINILDDNRYNLPVLKSAVFGEVSKIKTMLVATAGDQATRSHRQYMQQLIKKAMDSK